MKNNLFLHLKDTPSEGDHYEAYTTQTYLGTAYLIRKISVSGDVTTITYYSGVGDLATDWTNRASLTYTAAPANHDNVLLIGE